MNLVKTLSLALALALPVASSAASRPLTPFTDAEIDQMLAPIALYPDSVLSHVLIAATVPDDVDAAAAWIDRHPDRRGQEAVNAVDRYDWDPSVKALVAFPEVIERMAEDPEWTEELGLAFLEQEEVVLDRVQYLRDRAAANGSLDDLEHVRVVREREYIYLEPAVARVVYVPYYDPWRVYGHWWWASYPPHCWNWWAGRPVRHYYGSSFWWGVSFNVGPTWYAGRFNWPYRHVVVTRPHRHYAPSPGYSGRSSMRRENVAHRDTRHGSHRSPGRPESSRHGNSRPETARRDHAPVRRGHDRHDEGDTHRPQGQRQRRDSAEVRAALGARRNDSRRNDVSHEGGRNGPAWIGEARRPVDGQPCRAARSVEGGRHESRSRSEVARERVEATPERSSRPEPRGSSQGERSSERGSERSERAIERSGERAERAESPRSSESRGGGGRDAGRGNGRSGNSREARR